MKNDNVRTTEILLGMKMQTAISAIKDTPNLLISNIACKTPSNSDFLFVLLFIFAINYYY
jgi:hypothetical protein